jgi:hypothetical protein
MTKEYADVAALEIDLAELKKLPEGEQEIVMQNSFKQQIRPVIEHHSDVNANSKEAFEAWKTKQAEKVDAFHLLEEQVIASKSAYKMMGRKTRSARDAHNALVLKYKAMGKELEAMERIKLLIARLEGHGAFIKGLSFNEDKAYLELQTKIITIDEKTGYIELTAEEKKKLQKTKKLISLITEDEPTIDSLLEKEYTYEQTTEGNIMRIKVMKFKKSLVITQPTLST